jgi:hypothetical protein
MAKMTRKMGMGKHMSEEMDDEEDDEDESEDESEKTPKRRVKKVTVVETFAAGGAVRRSGCMMPGRGSRFIGVK